MTIRESIAQALYEAPFDEALETRWSDLAEDNEARDYWLTRADIALKVLTPRLEQVTKERDEALKTCIELDGALIVTVAGGARFQDRIAELSARLEQARGALLFYADEDVDSDGGKRAREALRLLASPPTDNSPDDPFSPGSGRGII